MDMPTAHSLAVKLLYAPSLASAADFCHICSSCAGTLFYNGRQHIVCVRAVHREKAAVLCVATIRKDRAVHIDPCQCLALIPTLKQTTDLGPESTSSDVYL